MKNIIYFSLVIFVLQNLSAKNNTVVEIDKLYKKAIVLKKTKNKPDFYFIRVWDDKNNVLLEWGKSSDKISPDKIFENLDFFYDNKNISSVVYSEYTPTGDWVKTTEYYFWENGSIAYIYSKLGTFYGGVIVERSFYYDMDGNEIKNSKSVKDIKTKFRINEKSKSYQDNPPITVHSFSEMINSFNLQGKLK